MDLSLAIERNRVILLRIVAGLMAMIPRIGRDDALARPVYLMILSVLRPAESAMRRLVAVAAVGMTAPPNRARPVLGAAFSIGSGYEKRLNFRLFDARLRLGLAKNTPPKAGPRVGVIGVDDPVFGDADMARGPEAISTQIVEKRLTALRDALEDVPKQARRLVRMLGKIGQKYRHPMRPGRPPGYRKKRQHEVDDILTECHALALYTLHPAPEP